MNSHIEKSASRYYVIKYPLTLKINVTIRNKIGDPPPTSSRYVIFGTVGHTLIASASTSSADNFCSVVVNHVIMSSISVTSCAGTFGTLWNVVWILLNSRLTAFHLLRMPIKHTSISCISSGVQSVRYLSRISTKLLIMGEFLSRVNRVSWREEEKYFSVPVNSLVITVCSN